MSEKKRPKYTKEFKLGQCSNREIFPEFEIRTAVTL
jgi:hypothetical protein